MNWARASGRTTAPAAAPVRPAVAVLVMAVLLGWRCSWGDSAPGVTVLLGGGLSRSRELELRHLGLGQRGRAHEGPEDRAGGGDDPCRADQGGECDQDRLRL